ncbi:MAG: RNA 2',3'-cyclic phosphodiesterase [Gallicola sp.]|nr:RNA 2',3'-cyclic phosphodiesterase [Gallicola sp.]
MRLFIGISLSEKTKTQLHTLQKELKPYLKTASFTKKDNLHLTLKFLGDCSKEDKNRIIESLNSKTFVGPFSIDFINIDTFSNRKGKILWAGSKYNPSLQTLYSIVEETLSGLSFEKENRTYKAHITLARRIQWGEKRKREIKKITEDISSFALFESVFTKRGVEYKELFRFYLR